MFGRNCSGRVAALVVAGCTANDSVRVEPFRMSTPKNETVLNSIHFVESPCMAVSKRFTATDEGDRDTKLLA